MKVYENDGVKVSNFAPDEDSITVEVGEDVMVQTYRDEHNRVYVRVWQREKSDETYELGAEDPTPTEASDEQDALRHTFVNEGTRED